MGGAPVEPTSGKVGRWILFGGPAVACIGFVLASLSFAGVNSVDVVQDCLWAAFAFGVIGTWLEPDLRLLAIRYRIGATILVAAVLGTALYWLSTFEVRFMQVKTPQPVATVVNTDEVARKVILWIQAHQLPANAPPQPSPRHRLVAEAPATNSPIIPPQSRIPPSKPPSSGLDPAFYKKMSDMIARNNKYNACEDAAIKVAGDMAGFVGQAIGDQNNWAYSRDGELLGRQYTSWVTAVHQFFADHPEVHGTEEFDQVQEYDMEPTLLVIPNSGVGAWNNFNNRGNALAHIEKAYIDAALKACDDAKAADATAATPAPPSPPSTAP